MTFTLDLTTDSITNRSGLWEIEAAMLWPENEVARRATVTASATEYGINHLPALSPDYQQQVGLHLKSRRPRVDDIQQAASNRYPYGEVVGVLTMQSLFGSKPLGKLQAEIAALLRRFKPELRLEPKTMNNRAGPLYKFRPVAHLWAAHVLYSAQGRPAFPCSVPDLPGFLATAEAIRRKAEATRLKNSPHMLMRVGEAVKLPEELSALLPRVDLLRIKSFPEMRP